MSRRPRRIVLRSAAFLLLAAVLGLACGRSAGSASPPPAEATAPAEASPPPAEADSGFATLIERFSERGRYFDTDNLISNESSYLHVLDRLRTLDLAGGAYIGVGPDQNFSYLAEVRPNIAFMVDIRRDNLLQHLFFKALFALSENRMAYLAHLFARPLPAEPGAWSGRELEDLLAYIDETEATQAGIDAARAAVRETVEGFGVPLSADDHDTIAYIHTRFIDAGLDLRFNSHNRRPQPYYPTFRQLLLETDRSGRRASYLVREEDYQFLRAMQAEDRIIPVVGDLGGAHALHAIADYLRARDEPVTAFYTSNVEYYLMGDGLFGAFCDNVEGLPRHPRGVLIRSYFNRFRAGHPRTVPGYASTQLLQSIDAFTRACTSGAYGSYGALMGDYLDDAP